jgi:hypothetical protein
METLEAGVASPGGSAPDGAQQAPCTPSPLATRFSTSRDYSRLSWLWAPLSAAFHLALGLAIVSEVDCTPKIPKMGSIELDIDDDQPRLASPKRNMLTGDDDGNRRHRMGARASQTNRSPRLFTKENSASRNERPTSERQAKREAVEANKRRLKKLECRNQEASKNVAKPVMAAKRVLKKLHFEQDKHGKVVVSDNKDRIRSTLSYARKATPAQRLLMAMAQVDPAAAVARTAAHTVLTSIRDRRSRHRRLLARARASDRRVKRLLTRMTARARGSVAAGAGRGSGAASETGLKFYLSGRRVTDSKVARPPEPTYVPRTACRVTKLSATPATVRMLIGRRGNIVVSYIRHSSKDRQFDRCALAHARAMRFRPGTDAAGTALDVWIHLRIEPNRRFPKQLEKAATAKHARLPH